MCSRSTIDPVTELEPNILRFHAVPMNETAQLQRLQQVLFQQLLQVLLQCQQNLPTLPVTFMYRHQSILQIDLDPMTTQRSLAVIIRHAFRLLNFNGTPRVLLGGLNCDQASTLQEHALKRNLKQVIIHIGDPLTLRLTGGGGTKPPTNKQDFAKLVEANAANMFLEYEVNLPQIPALVTKLIDKVSSAKVHQTLMIANQGKKHEQFQALCQQADIKLPASGPRRSEIQGKFQRLHDRKHQKTALAIEPSHFRLKSGFFRNADGTAAKLLTQFSPHASGILMTNTQTAQEWANVFTTLATDELGLYVLGPPPKTQLPCTQVCAPAIHVESGKEVLLNGVLLQFGAKQLHSSADVLDAVETKNTQIASVTAWKADFDPAQWQQIQESPVKTILSLLAPDNANGLLLKAWGRVWQKDGVNVSPAAALSFQFHGEFSKTPEFNALLKRSGFSRLFLQPKGSNGKPDDQWRVIWLPGTALEIETKTAALVGTAGLVRSRKGLGIRIESGAFSQAWRLLKPDQPEPEANHPSLIFRLYPLPHGVDASILRAWAETQFGWQIKPIKSTGARQWIVACDRVPEGFLTFNGQPLLLQQLPQKGATNHGLVMTGPRVELPMNTSDNQKPLQEDPWAAAAKSLPSSSSRAVEGPVSSMFQQQDSRLSNLEQAMQKMQVSQAEATKALQDRQQVLEGHLQQHVQTTQAGFDRVQHEEQTLQQTVAMAMNKHEDRLVAAFEDIKALIMHRGTKRASEDPAQDLLEMNE